YTFADVRDNHTFAAYFTLRTFTVEITAGEGGNVTPNGTVAVNYGDSLAVSITPADCYDIASVVVNGESIAATDSYVFRQITENQTLDVMFAQREYTLTATAGEGGTVTPAGATTVACGNSQTYTVVPDEGYEIAYLMVDGDSVAAAGSYTFSDIREDHTFEAYFTLQMFTVEITAGEGGNVTPNGTVTVNYGDSLAVSIVPDDCYEIASIVVNGDNIGITDSYVFYQITENQTLDVVFAPTFYAVTLDVYMNGELVLSDSMSVECGTDTSVYVPEFDCFEVVSLEVNGESVDVENPIEITDVRNNYHVVAELMAEQYQIVATTQGQGTLTPADTSWVTCSSSITYTFTADTGWFVQELIVDGHSFGTPTSNTYTFPNVIANHTIEVIFSLNEYIITSTVHPIDAGQINPYGTHIYTAGDSASYTIMAFPNYYIVDVQVDGVSVGSVSSYTFTNINENHTIEAFFATTDIEEAIENEVVVYAHEHTVYVRSEGIGRVREVEIYDMQGRRVVRQVGEGNEMRVDVPAAQGIYVVRVATTEGMLSRKVMITRR
nr:T9SS type A sorting domain-containing protein [Bacteroidales bacterium]